MPRLLQLAATLLVGALGVLEATTLEQLSMDEMIQKSTGIVRAKVVEFCTAGGVTDLTFIKVSAPDQVLTKRELAKYLEAEVEKER